MMTERPRTLGVIPVRGGSKGVPRKNIKALGGKPLLQYTVEAAQRSSGIDHLVVSTEDAEIAAVARELGVEVIERPAALATDTTPTHPVIAHALALVEERLPRFDYVFTLQVTTPFRTAADIDGAIDSLRTSGAESVIGVVRVFDQHPARIKRIEGGRLREFCVPEEEGSRRQDLEPAYLRNGAIYVCRRDVIERGSLRGDDQCPYEMPPERSINIDEPIDFLLAEAVLRGEHR